MLAVSNTAAERNFTSSLQPAPVGAIQTNALASVTVPAPPTGMRTHLIAVYCGYSGGTLVAAALTLPGGQNPAVNGMVDSPIEIQSPFLTASFAVTLAAGGSGIIGFLVCQWEFVG